MNTRPTMTLLEHNRRVVQEALSPLNVWGTGEEFHHPPRADTHEGKNELLVHFIHSGAIQHLREEHDVAA